jgi:hypothetical protein
MESRNIKMSAVLFPRPSCGRRTVMAFAQIGDASKSTITEGEQHETD